MPIQSPSNSQNSSSQNSSNENVLAQQRRRRRSPQSGDAAGSNTSGPYVRALLAELSMGTLGVHGASLGSMTPAAAGAVLGDANHARINPFGHYQAGAGLAPPALNGALAGPIHLPAPPAMRQHNDGSFSVRMYEQGHEVWVPVPYSGFEPELELEPSFVYARVARPMGPDDDLSFFNYAVGLEPSAPVSANHHDWDFSAATENLVDWTETDGLALPSLGQSGQSAGAASESSVNWAGTDALAMPAPVFGALQEEMMAHVRRWNFAALNQAHFTPPSHEGPVYDVYQGPRTGPALAQSSWTGILTDDATAQRIASDVNASPVLPAPQNGGATRGHGQASLSAAAGILRCYRASTANAAAAAQRPLPRPIANAAAAAQHPVPRPIGGWSVNESTMRPLRLQVARESVFNLLRQRGHIQVNPTAALNAAAAFLPSMPEEWRLSARPSRRAGVANSQRPVTEEQRVRYVLAPSSSLRRGERYESVPLNLLFAHAWALIDEQPEPQRTTLRSTLVRNLAEFIDEATDSLVCPTGMAQRIIEPLHQLLPGVFTVERMPSELVFETAAVLRRRIAEAGDSMSPTEVEAAVAAWERDCRTEAAARFPETMPLYREAKAQLEEAFNLARAEF